METDTVHKLFRHFVWTLVIYHAHMEQQIIINATDPTVINREIPKLFQKFVLRIPLE